MRFNELKVTCTWVPGILSLLCLQNTYDKYIINVKNLSTAPCLDWSWWAIQLGNSHALWQDLFIALQGTSLQHIATMSNYVLVSSKNHRIPTIANASSTPSEFFTPGIDVGSSVPTRNPTWGYQQAQYWSVHDMMHLSAFCNESLC